MPAGAAGCAEGPEAVVGFIALICFVAAAVFGGLWWRLRVRCDPNVNVP